MNPFKTHLTGFKNVPWPLLFQTKQNKQKNLDESIGSFTLALRKFCGVSFKILDTIFVSYLSAFDVKYRTCT